MGFYSTSQIVQDARRGRADRVGVQFLPVDAVYSDYDNLLVGGTFFSEMDDGVQPAVRLGLREIRGLSERAARAIVAARVERAFLDVADLCRRSGIDDKARTALAEAGALKSLAGHRHDARWIAAGIERQPPLAFESPSETPIVLPAPGIGEDIVSDYRSVGLTLSAHPMSLLRDKLRKKRVLGSRELHDRRHGSHVHTAGLVTQRQRPATAKGTIFVTLEDEHGMVNVIVWPHVAMRRRKALLGSRLLAVRGRWEKVDGVEHLIANDLEDLSAMLGRLQTASRDFH
jgi:error-prone DNA polymerase